MSIFSYLRLVGALVLASGLWATQASASVMGCAFFSTEISNPCKNYTGTYVFEGTDQTLGLPDSNGDPHFRKCGSPLESGNPKV